MCVRGGDNRPEEGLWNTAETGPCVMSGGAGGCHQGPVPTDMIRLRKWCGGGGGHDGFRHLFCETPCVRRGHFI